jgi:hypothetical protein
MDRLDGNTDLQGMRQMDPHSHIEAQTGVLFVIEDHILLENSPRRHA